MAITEYPKQIVRIEHDPSAGTAEGEVYVCADGSRWKPSFAAEAGTSKPVAYRRGDQVISPQEAA